jgi:YVTN family beta-propeller protein
MADFEIVVGKRMKRAVVGILTIGLAACLGGACNASSLKYRIAEKFKMPDGGWDYATSDMAKGLVYWVRTDHTDVIDAKSRKLSILHSLGNGHMAVVVEGTSLVVVPLRSPAKTTRVVDTSNDTVVADLPSGEAPDGAIYDSFSKNVYVINHNSSDITVVDPMARKVVATIPVGGGKLEFPASDGAGKVFVNVQAAGEVAVIDVKTNTKVTNYKMAGCEDASGLAFAAKSKLLVASCGNGTARVLTAESGKEIASIKIGAGPDAVIYDPLREVAFVPCGESGVLEIISLADPAKPVKIQSIKMPSLARTGAVDPQGRLYVMAARPDLSKPKGGGGRPAPMDGTFEMVVISP